MKIKPSDIKPIKEMESESILGNHQEIVGFGKAEYEWIITRAVQESQKVDEWVYIRSFAEQFTRKSYCLSFMREMHNIGLLDKEKGHNRYKLSNHSIEIIAENYHK